MAQTVTLKTGKTFTLDALTVRQTRDITSNPEPDGFSQALRVASLAIGNAGAEAALTPDQLSDMLSPGELIELQSQILEISGLLQGEAKAAIA